MQSDKFYTVQQTAKILSVSDNTVRNYIRKDIIPAYRLGKRYLIEKSELDRQFKQNKL